jgi:hypothetical protein
LVSINYSGVDNFKQVFYKIGLTVLRKKYNKHILLNNIGKKIIKKDVVIKIMDTNNILFVSDWGRSDPCIFGDCNVDKDSILVSYKVSPFSVLSMISIISLLFYDFILQSNPHNISDILFGIFIIIMVIGLPLIFYIIKINSIRFDIDHYINNEI